MEQSGVSLASLGIVATLVAGLIWLLKAQFNQNNSTIQKNTDVIEKLTDVIDELSDSLKKRDKTDHDFQIKVSNILDKISTTQDTISERQVKMYKTLNTSVLNVDTMNVNKEFINDGKQPRAESKRKV